MRAKHICVIAGLLLVGAAARAQIPAPDTAIQPEPRPGEAPALPEDAPVLPDARPAPAMAHPSNLHLLSPADHDLFLRAFSAADRGDWAMARTLLAEGQDPVARSLLEWRMLADAASGASFAEIDAFLKNGLDWPLRGQLLARAEQSIPPEMSNPAVIAWFAGRDPVTSPGRIRLGEALIARGDAARGRELVQRGWILGSFDAATEAAILQRDGSFFTPEIQAARLDSLIWRGEVTAARRQIARAGPRARAVAEARLALRSGLTKSARTAIANVPAEAASDPSLLFDRAAAERHAGQDVAAHRLLLQVDPAAMIAGHAARWWAESNVEARDALSDGDPRTALALVEHAGFTAGDEYAEAEFLAGFIALRFLDDPRAARTHFAKLGAGVSRPISRARAAYWQGRADEAMGDKAGAWQQYHLAGGDPDTFYGQLALARIDRAPMLHLADMAVTAAPESTLGADPLMAPMRVLADLGQSNYLRLFALRDAGADPAPPHVKRLVIDLTDWGYREIAVRLAKTASYDGVAMPAFTHPVIALPPYKGPGTAPDAALVLGIIRQETEFNPTAVSSAGARGIMQVMSFTARKSAKIAGLPYRPDALLNDADYDIQLGMIELAGNISDWNGSLVLAAAAYNAGPRNAMRWIAANGDPREAGVDPVDWIEKIPFGETRNYVERVLENTEVYRARLAGHDAALRLLADLYAPGAPAAPVLDYTPPAPAPGSAPAPAPRPNSTN